MFHWKISGVDSVDERGGQAEVSSAARKNLTDASLEERKRFQRNRATGLFVPSSMVISASSNRDFLLK